MTDKTIMPVCKLDFVKLAAGQRKTLKQRDSLVVTIGAEIQRLGESINSGQADEDDYAALILLAIDGALKSGRFPETLALAMCLQIAAAAEEYKRNDY